MILTWLWKMFLAFRRGREQTVLEAPKAPAALGGLRDDAFINQSNDTNNSGVVIFEGDAVGSAPPQGR